MSREVQLFHEDETYAIRGAAFEVYRIKGPGYVEPVYQECFAIELQLRDIEFNERPELNLEYKGRPLRSKYIPDFLCFKDIIVELKAVSALADEHRAQVHNYLKATGYKLGLLINFGFYPGAEIERIVR